MLVGTRARGARLDVGHHALRKPLQLEQSFGISLFAVHRSAEVIRLARQFGCRLLVDFDSNLEQAELIEVACVLDDVLPDAGNERGPQMSLIGGDRVQHADVIVWIQAEAHQRVFAEERVVVNLVEALIGDKIARP